jgi:hypothetical protein
VVDAARAHIDGAQGSTGVCRRYCCDNICSGAGAFCDKETTVSGAVAVPVCVTRAWEGADAGVACELLDDTSCGGSGLSCQLVDTATGQVACVTPGTATAGQSCELANCASGFSCVVGYFPARRCAQLCDVENGNCSKGETCTANAALSTVNAHVGVCM